MQPFVFLTGIFNQNEGEKEAGGSWVSSYFDFEYSCFVVCFFLLLSKKILSATFSRRFMQKGWILTCFVFFYFNYSHVCNQTNSSTLFHPATFERTEVQSLPNTGLYRQKVT